MKIKLIAILIFALVANTTNAQDARAILDKASKAYENAGGITAKFTLDSKDVSNNTTYSQDGRADMKGDRFKLDVPDGITWFDGKTQWGYIKDTNEVNVSNPTGDELKSISPSAMFNIYKAGFDLKYIGEKVVNGARVYHIELQPQAIVKKSSDITKLEVLINKQTHIFAQIAIHDKSGFINTVSIRDIKTGIALDDNVFKFDSKSYPNAETIDLR